MATEPETNEHAYRQALARASEQIRALLKENRRLQEPEPVAVIGMGCRFPGGAESPDAFWKLLADGRDAVIEVPRDRWPIGDFFDPDGDAPGKMYIREGAFLERAHDFDAGFFGVTPPEAEALDPQQRLLLEVVWEAFEDAALDVARLRGSNTGVFLGLCNQDYIKAHIYSGDPRRITSHSISGVMYSTAAGRLSYHFDLRGPCVTSDTACSSSLVALHQAVRSLQAAECETAIAAGVNLVLSAESTIALCKVKALAPDGRCRPFDDSASGYARGEGCGVVVLKSLSGAVRDGDRILALVKGSAVNHDGRSNGLTAPNGLAQQEVIAKALAAARTPPRQVQYVEAHGTGTQLGDPIEVLALDRAYGVGRGPSNKLRVGSVKSNIGHGEAAAGIAGVVKVVLAMNHGTIPATIHLRAPNHHIPWGDVAVSVVDRPTAWSPPDGAPRRAGVSAFGFSGTNAHVLIEQAPPPPELPPSNDPAHLLILSARSRRALEELTRRYVDRLAGADGPDLADVCHTAAKRSRFAHRLAVVAATRAEAVRALSDFPQSEPGAFTYRDSTSDAPEKNDVAFLFPGPGSQYVGMGRALLDLQPSFRGAMERCDALLGPHLGRSLLELIRADGPDASAALARTDVSQPATVAVECALVEMWRGWGVEPAAVAGHGCGELAAAYAAGVFSLEDAVRLAAVRGRLTHDLPADGAMAALAASEERARPLFAPFGDAIAGVGAQRIGASHAFHSPRVASATGALRAAAAGVEFRRSSIPFYSTATGSLVSPEELASPDYWCRQMLQPVLFLQALQGLAQAGCRTFLELGPSDALTRFARQSLDPSAHAFLAPLGEGQCEWRRTLGCLAELFARGRDVPLDAIYSRSPRRKVALPTYPFQRKQYRLDPPPPLNQAFSTPKTPSHAAPQAAKGDDVLSPEHRLREETAVAGAPAGRAERRDVILGQLCDIACEVMQVPREELNPRTPLLEMGADSIVLARVIQRIERTYGIRVSVRQLFEEYNTLPALAGLIVAEGARGGAPELAGPQDAQSADTLSVPPAPPSTSRGPRPDENGKAARPLPVGAACAVPVSQPVWAAPAPAVGSGAVTEDVSKVLTLQLETMERVIRNQLEVLGGLGAGPAGKSDPPRPAVVPVPPTPAPTPTPTPALAPPAAPGPRRAAALPPWGVAEKEARWLDDRQKEYLAHFTSRYNQRTATSKRLADSFRPVLADNRSSAGFRLTLKELQYPIYCARSKGAYFWDEDGRRFLDMTMGFGVNLFGHNPDFVRRGLEAQLARGAHLGPQDRQAGEAAALVAELTGAERVAFCTTGTEAVMTALRMARVATGRPKTAVFRGSYHGHFDGVLVESAGEGPMANPSAPGVLPSSLADVIALEYGDPRSLGVIREHGRELAAILVEPVQSRRPDLQPVEFLKELRRLADELGTVLIFDEMVTGFRVHAGGAQALFGIRADLATYGKVVGGGLPIGVIAGRAGVMDTLDGGPWRYGDDSHPSAQTTFYAGTYNKHPLAMAAAVAVLRHLRDSGPELQDGLNRRTARLAAELNEHMVAHDVPLRAVHFGSLVRFSFSRNMDLFFYHLLDKGIYVWEGRACFLSTAHTDADVEAFVQAVKDSIEELRAGGMLTGVRPYQAPARADGPGATAGSQEAGSPGQGAIWNAGRIALKKKAANVAPFRRVPVRPMQFSLSYFGSYASGELSDAYEFLFTSARFADEHGFAAVWLPERHFHAFGGFCPNPSVLAAALARQTRRIGLRAGSVVLPLHHPCRVAEEWAVVDQISGGRVGLACASGWHPNDFALAPEQFGNHKEVTYQRIEEIRRLWAGQELRLMTGEGKEISVSLHPRPVQKELPLWATIVNNPDTYTRAGRLGIGVLTNLMGQTPEELAVNIRLYRDALAEAGHPEERAHVTVLLHTYLGDDLATTRGEARQPVQHYLTSALQLFQSIARQQGLPSDVDALSGPDRQYLLDAAYERYVQSSALIGTPESCAPIVEGLLAAGVDEIGCLVDFGMPPDKAMASCHVLNRLKEACQTARPAGPAGGRSDPRESLAAPAGAPAAARDPVPAPPESTHALTSDQRQLWVQAQVDPTAGVAYVDPTLIRLRGALNVAALQSAVDRVVARHENLRSAVAADGSAQQVFSSVKVPIEVVDMRGGDDFRQWCEGESRRPFDMSKAPLVRLHLLHRGAAEHVFAVTSHHVMLDGWSVALFLEEVAAVYSAAVAGREAKLAPPVQIADLVRHRETADTGDHARFWLEHLGDLPAALELPTDRPHPPMKTYRGGKVRKTLPDALVKSVSRLSSRSGCTPFMTLHCAFAVLLNRVTGQDDFLISIVSANRNDSRLERWVGYCANLLPLRHKMDPDESFSALLRRTRGLLLSAFEHEAYPYGDLLEQLKIDRRGGRNPLISVVFNAETALPSPTFEGLELEVLPSPVSFRAYDLALNVLRSPDGLAVEADYNRDLFDEATVDRLLGLYRTLLEAVVADPEKAVSALPLLTAHELQAVLEASVGEPGPGRARACVHELFESQAAANPAAVAARWDGGALTYAELDARANRLAHRLNSLGVGPEVLVAVNLRRTPSLIVAILGVLKAGGAYLPLDPENPVDRLERMLEDSRAAVLITQAELSARIKTGPAARICMDDPTDVTALDRQPSTRPVGRAGPEHLAYVIYTSGSTGAPKGVMVTHAGLSHYVAWAAKAYRADQGVGSPVHTSIGFDLTVTSLFLPLASGRRLDLLPEGAGVKALLKAMRAGETYSFVKLTPAHLRMLAAELRPEEAAGMTRAFIIGGEQLHAESLAPWRDHAPETTLVNEYGPTETVVGCCVHYVSAGDPRQGVVPIGRPITATRLYVLDRNRTPVPFGVTGELYIGGAGVARGYLGQPGLTQERFVADPFAPEPGARMYRTGDLVRRRADGTLVFLGRADHQVKVRGFRIELGEVEAALGQCPLVEEAAVAVLGRDGDARLASWFTATEGPAHRSSGRTGAGFASELRNYLGSKLPAYMIPSTFVRVDRFPRTPNGKIDRRALAALPENNRPLEEDKPTVGPRNPFEAALVKAWKQVLNVENVGVGDEFLALGGDSIRAILVVGQLHQQGLMLEVGDLLRGSTIAELAKRVGAVDPAPATAPDPVRSGLTPIQHWFFENHQTDREHFNQAVLLEFEAGAGPEAFAVAINALVEHHGALRTRFLMEPSEICQEIAPPGAAPKFEVADLRGEPDWRRRLAAHAEALQTGFDLERGPLIKAGWYQTPQGARAVLVLHHLVVDGVSWRILLDDLATAYIQARDHQAIELPLATDSIISCALAQRDFAAHGALKAEAPFWSAAERAETSPLPYDVAHTENRYGDSEVLESSIAGDETQDLLTRANRAHLTRPDELLLAALTIALQDWLVGDRVRLLLEGHGREGLPPGVDASRTVGWFTDLYPVVLDLPRGRDVGSHITSIKGAVRGVPRHGVGYGILRYLSPAGAENGLVPRRNHEISFNYLGQFHSKSQYPFTVSADPIGATRSPRLERPQILEFEGIVIDGVLKISVRYNTKIHRRQTADRLLEGFLAALKRVIGHCLGHASPDRPPIELRHTRLTTAEWQALARRLGDAADRVEDVWPLSPMQEGMLFYCLAAPEARAYFEQFSFRLIGPLDPTVYRETWKLLAERHPALRALFVHDVSDRPLQVVLAGREPEFLFEDLRGTAADQQGARIDAHRRADIARSFNFQRDPLLRVAVFQTRDDGFEVVWSHHHIILDGWSVSVLLDDFATIYDALRAGRAPGIAPAGRYGEFLDWLERRDRAPMEMFWKDYLEGCESWAALPRKEAARPDLPYDMREHSFSLSEAESAALAQLSAPIGATPGTVFQAIWSLVLSAAGRSRDVVYGLVSAGRPAELAGVGRIVGLFLRMTPARVRVVPGESFGDLARRIQRDAAAREPNQFLPLTEILDLSPLRGRLLDHSFVFENYPMAEQMQSGACRLPAGLAAEAAGSFEQTSFDFSIIIQPGNCLGVKFTYNGRLFDANQFGALERAWRRVAAAVLTGGDVHEALRPLPGEAPLSEPDPSDPPRTAGAAKGETVLDLFEARANENSRAVAVEAGQETLTYGELRQRVEALARVLRGLGLGRGEVAGLFMPNGADHVASLLAVHRACGAFMPIDPNSPVRRLEGIFDRAEPVILITSASLRGRLRETLAAIRLNRGLRTVVYIDPSGAATCETPDGRPAAPSGAIESAERSSMRPAAEDDAYLIFTSGTTGEPKLIRCNHHGLCHFVNWQTEAFAFGPGTRASNLALPTFDVSLREILSPLTSGGTVCVPDAETRMSPPRLLDWLIERRVDVINIVPSVLRLLLNEAEPRSGGGGPVLDPRYVFCAGEPLFGKDVRRLRGVVGERCRIVNLYGPSETTLAKFFHVIPPGADVGDGMIPVGRPIPGAEALLIKNASPIPPGDIGEVYIKTPFRLGGYHRDPELTAAHFVPNPLSGENGQLVYRTGDFARQREDGALEFMGRLDRQVKLRGVRIELAEVDRAVLATGLVNQSYAVIHKRDGRDEYLTCYYTASSGRIEPGAFRNALSDFLPPAMVPDLFLCLPSFPLGVNGKIDRRALPKPEELIYQGTAYEPPADEIETRLELIWRELLALERVGVTSPFLDLGGTSLIAMRIVSRVKRDLGADLNVRLVFDKPTIRELAAVLRSGGARTRPEIARVPRRPNYAVSHAQRRLWILDRLGSGAAYNILGAYRLEGGLDVERLRTAVDWVVSRHESLRTTFMETGGELRQVIHEPGGPVLEVVDLSNQPRPEAAAHELARNEVANCFDLAAGPLLRVRLVRLAERCHLLLANVHHIVFDGGSTQILLEEVGAAYATFGTGGPPPLPPPAVQYKDFAAWQNALLEEEGGRRHRDYWHNQFSTLPAPLELPRDAAPSQLSAFDGDRTSVHIDEALSGELKSLAANSGGSLFMLLVAVVKAALARYTGQEDIVVGVPISNRNHEQLGRQIGFFVNSLALRDRVSGDDRFIDVLEKVKRTAAGAYEHAEYPFDRLVDALSPERDPNRHPLFEVMVILQEDHSARLELEGVAVSEVGGLFPVLSRLPLVVEFTETAHGLRLDLEYNTRLFRRGRVERMAEHLVNIARSAVKDPSAKVARLDLLSDRERLQLLELGRGTVAPLDATLTIVGMFENSAAEFFNAPALVHEDVELTYAELKRKADALSGALARTAGPREIVAVFLDRSEWSAIAFLGVLKAGAVYLPIDPEYPDERIAWMLEDSRSRVVLSEPKWQGHPALKGREVLDVRGLAAGERGAPARAVGHHDPAYLIYTSGSTGRPKGVLLEHGGAANLALAHTRDLGIAPGERVLQFAPCSFDASIWEMVMALARGACLVIAGAERVRDPRRLAECLRNNHVTVATLPPTVIAQMDAEDLKGLRLLVSAGEPARADDALYLCDHMRVVNAYGPTETTVCATFHAVSRDRNYERGVPIGRPLTNLGVVLLDARGQPVPLGVPGEICVSGPALARGYLYRDELTRQCFIDHPLARGERLYRTGDLGIWNEAGELEYLGRRDHQVKIRGHRVELGEIEQVLTRDLGLDTVVVALPDGSGGQQLAAYIAGDPNLGEFRERLARKLPSYMIPTAWVALPALPLTPNGKIDRAALPSPGDSAAARTAGHVDPRNPLESILVQIWQEVLGRERISVHDSFFELGGDSILAIQLANRLHRRGLKLATRDLFRSPTIAELAPTIRAHDSAETAACVEGSFPLSPIQAWFFEHHSAHANQFNQSILLEARGRIDATAMTSALASIVKHHPALRLGFPKERGERVARYASNGDEPVLREVDLSDQSDPDLAPLTAEQHAGLDVERGPLIRARLVRLANRDRLLIVIHHLVVDFVSWRILMEDLGQAYALAAAGSEVVLPPATDSYQRWVGALAATAKAPSVRRQSRFWADFDAAPAVSVPPDFPLGSNRYGDVESVQFVLTETETADLLGRANRTYGTDVQDLLLAGLATALSAFGRSRGGRVLVEGHGREPITDDVNINRTVGWFTSIYPLVLDFDEAGDVGRQIKWVKERRRTVPDNGIGYGVLRYLTPDGLGPVAGPPTIGFNYLGRFDSRGPADSFFTVLKANSGPTKHPEMPRWLALEFEAAAVDGRMEFSIAYSRRLHSRRTAEGLLEHCRDAIARTLEHCCDPSRGRDLTPSDVSTVPLGLDEFERLFKQ